MVREGLPDWLARRLDPGARYGLRLTLLAVALVLVAVPFGLLLDQVKRGGPLLRADTYAANHLHGWMAERPAAVTVAEVVSFLGSPVCFWLLIPLGAAYWAWRRRPRLATYLLATSLLGGVVDTVVKELVDRDRPLLAEPIATAHGKSFPSGHTMLTTYGYGALLLAFLPLLPPRLRRWAIGAWAVMVVAVAMSRLGLGVHYITDVLGGAVLGLAWLALATAAFSIWRVERGRRPVHPSEGVEPEAAAPPHGGTRSE